MNQSAASQCAPCCAPCGFIKPWPSTIHVAFSGVQVCPCITVAGGTGTITDLSALNTKIALSGSASYGEFGWSGYWTATITLPTTSYSTGNCSDSGEPVTPQYRVSVSISNNGTDCFLGISCDLLGSGIGDQAFNGGADVTAATVFNAVANQACGAAGGIFAGGGTAIVSLT